MKKGLMIILLFLTYSCFSQVKQDTKNNKITLLTNDSVKYWDFISSDYTPFNKIGICLLKNNRLFYYSYFRNIKYQRIYESYEIDNSLDTISFNVLDDTLSIEDSQVYYKIKHLSNDSLVLSVYICCIGRSIICFYKPSLDQQSTPMPLEYWYEIYKDAIKNKQDTLIYKKP